MAILYEYVTSGCCPTPRMSNSCWEAKRLASWKFLKVQSASLAKNKYFIRRTTYVRHVVPYENHYGHSTSYVCRIVLVLVPINLNGWQEARSFWERKKNYFLSSVVVVFVVASMLNVWVRVFKILTCQGTINPFNLSTHQSIIINHQSPPWPLTFSRLWTYCRLIWALR
jgi:hypothetical protein